MNIRGTATKVLPNQIPPPDPDDWMVLNPDPVTSCLSNYTTVPNVHILIRELMPVSPYEDFLFSPLFH